MIPQLILYALKDGKNVCFTEIHEAIPAVESKPEPDRLVAHLDPTLAKKVLDIA